MNDNEQFILSNIGNFAAFLSLCCARAIAEVTDSGKGVKGDFFFKIGFKSSGMTTDSATSTAIIWRFLRLREREVFDLAS